MIKKELSKLLVLLSFIFILINKTEQQSVLTKKPANQEKTCNNSCLVGRDGRDGRDGVDGIDGQNGLTGKKGRNGRDGKDGRNGLDGKDGRNGKDLVRNWKECAWNKITDGKNAGLIKNCAFQKKLTSTYLRVVAHSSVRITGCTYCCARWFVTFDGRECSPIPIDGVAYQDINQDVVRPHVITGYCNIKKTGAVDVTLNVGVCGGSGKKTGDALTGWQSSTRIMVEEIEPPQI